jgi:hypothetical protein
MELSILNEIEKSHSDEINSKEYYNESIILEQERDKILNEAVEYINEAYIGKTDLLQRIEEQIGVVRMHLDRNKPFDSNPEVLKLNRLFEEQFGMQIFALHMDPHKEIDAYTIRLCTNFDIAGKIDYPKSVIIDRDKGFRFKPGNNFCINIVINFGILGSPDFTDGEILAIILHEIGHNFADFIDNKIRLQSINIVEGWKELLLKEAIFMSLLIITIPFVYLDYKNTIKYNTNEYKNQAARKAREKSSVISAKVSAMAANIGDFFEDIKSTLYRYNPIKRVIAKSNARVRNLYKDELAKSARESLDRRNEIIADKFAGMYGYGVELASSFQKLGNYVSRSDRWLMKLPGGEKVNNTWKDLFKDINEFDCHPHSIQRINENIKLLKDELKQEDMDPKLKNVIIKEISEMEDIVKNIANKVKDNPDDIQAKYDAFVNEKLPDATTEKIENEITDELNKLLERKKK